jgi:hypothetical protein
MELLDDPRRWPAACSMLGNGFDRRLNGSLRVVVGVVVFVAPALTVFPPSGTPLEAMLSFGGGGPGNLANSLGGPMYDSGSSARCPGAGPPLVLACVRDGTAEWGNTCESLGGENVGGFARMVVGFVPARVRGPSGGTGGGGDLGVRSWAADTDGRSCFRRGATDPCRGREDISSPFAEGPADEGFDEYWDLISVDALPLRFRRMYFSIASASCRSVRVAMGVSADAGLADGV